MATMSRSRARLDGGHAELWTLDLRDLEVEYSGDDNYVAAAANL